MYFVVVRSDCGLVTVINFQNLKDNALRYTS